MRTLHTLHSLHHTRDEWMDRSVWLSCNTCLSGSPCCCPIELIIVFCNHWANEPSIHSTFVTYTTELPRQTASAKCPTAARSFYWRRKHFQPITETSLTTEQNVIILSTCTVGSRFLASPSPPYRLFGDGCRRGGEMLVRFIIQI